MVIVQKKLTTCSAGPRDGVGGGPAGQPPEAPTDKRCKDVTEIIGNMVLVNIGFYIGKNFSEICPQFGHAPSKLFTSPFRSQRRLKNIGLKGAKLLVCRARQIISPPGEPVCLQSALAGSRV